MRLLPGPLRRPFLAGRTIALQWAFLLAASALFASVMALATLPAVFLVGPMLAAVWAGAAGSGIVIARPVFGIAQAVVGGMVAGALSADLVPAFLADWPILLSAVFATLAASSALGWLISRWRILPGTTGLWGSAPGAASAMVLMAGAFGADQRLVAFMQYLRVMMVSAAAALVARWSLGEAPVAQPPVDWLGPIDVSAFAATLAVVLAGAGIAVLLRLPTPYFLGSMVAGLAAKFGGLVEPELPPLLLAASFAVIGWSIGIRFTADTVRQVRASLARVALSILVLMGFCGVVALLLVRFAGVDPLTAYLATSPGGMDAIAIVASASRDVDMTFIMTMQMLRFLVVLLLGPALARLLAPRAGI